MIRRRAVLCLAAISSATILFTGACGTKAPPPISSVPVSTDTATVTLEPIVLHDVIIHQSQPVRLGPLESFHVASEITSRIASLPVEVGEFVGKDQPVVILEPLPSRRDGIALAADRLRQAARSHEAAGLMISRVEAAYEDGLVSRQYYEDALNRYQTTLDEKDAAQTALDNINSTLAEYALVAPFAGIITSRSASAHEVARAGATLLIISPVNPLRADAVVPAQLAEALREGDLVDVAARGETLPAFVLTISPFLDSGAENRHVALSVPNPGNFVPFGAEGIARFPIHSRRRVPAVPLDRIRRDEKGDSYLLTMNQETNQAERRDISTGLSAGGWVEIVSGAVAGDMIISSSSRSIVPGDHVSLELELIEEASDTPTQ